MSMIFRYAFCNNKLTLILHGSKAVWYDDDSFFVRLVGDLKKGVSE